MVVGRTTVIGDANLSIRATTTNTTANVDTRRQRDAVLVGMDDGKWKKNSSSSKRRSKQQHKQRRRRTLWCPTCGVQTHKRAFLRNNKPLTVAGSVYKGRCLNCHPLGGEEQSKLDPQRWLWQPRPPPPTRLFRDSSGGSATVLARVGDDHGEGLALGTSSRNVPMDIKLIPGVQNWSPSHEAKNDPSGGYNQQLSPPPPPQRGRGPQQHSEDAVMVVPPHTIEINSCEDDGDFSVSSDLTLDVKLVEGARDWDSYRSGHDSDDESPGPDQLGLWPFDFSPDQRRLDATSRKKIQPTTFSIPVTNTAAIQRPARPKKLQILSTRQHLVVDDEECESDTYYSWYDDLSNECAPWSSTAAASLETSSGQQQQQQQHNDHDNSCNFAASTTKFSDKEEVLALCEADGSWALKHASSEMQADVDVVLVACRQDSLALRYASAELRANKWVVMAACEQNGRALQYAAKDLQADRDIVLEACRQNGLALKYASAKLQADKDIVLVATSSDPDALRYASTEGMLNQDPECLKAAGLIDSCYPSASPFSTSQIVLSTRFSLVANSRSQATRFAVLLKEHVYIRTKKFGVYSPNAVVKGTCDPEWTRSKWPCRGTFGTCQKPELLKRGIPQPESCWRYSFRYQLERAKRNNGCMVQLVERDGPNVMGPGSPQRLGKGQEIEAEMAKDVGIKVFCVHAPVDDTLGWDYDFDFNEEHIAVLASRIKEWYSGGCSDMSDCVLRLH